MVKDRDMLKSTTHSDDAKVVMNAIDDAFKKIMSGKKPEPSEIDAIRRMARGIGGGGLFARKYGGDNPIEALNAYAKGFHNRAVKILIARGQLKPS